MPISSLKVAFDVLFHERRFANTLWTSDYNQSCVPINLLHDIAYIPHRNNGDISIMTFKKSFHITVVYII